MTARALAAHVARAWSAVGTRVLFGVPGGGVNLDVVGGAEAAGTRFVLAHDETAAAIMASAYGLITNTVGAAVVTRGPGLTAAATGLAQATLDRFPLLLVSDAVPQQSAARVSHQRLDQEAMARSLAKWSGVLGMRDPAGVARAAVALARRGPAGGVHLAVDPTAEGAQPPTIDADPDVDAVALEGVLARIRRARYPVVLLGPAGVDAPGIGDLAAAGIPVMCTYQAKGAVPDAHSAGLFTGGVLERPLLEQADLVLAVGVDPVEAIPSTWDHDAPVVMLNPHPVDARWFGKPHVVIGPLAVTVPAALEALDARWAHDTASEHRKRALEAIEPTGQEFTPHDVVRELAEWARPEATLTVDAGAHMLVVMPLWATDVPRRVLISNGLATMGFAVPAAIGAALARPGQQVVCCVGDGGLGMTLAELETIARLDLDITVAVFDDAALSLIEIKQTEGQGDAGAVRYGAIDFVQVARGLGIPAGGVDSRGELRAYLSSRPRGPALIDARIDPTCYAAVLRATRG